MKRRPPISRRTFIKLTATVAAGVGGCFFFLQIDLKERYMPPAPNRQLYQIMKLNT